MSEAVTLATPLKVGGGTIASLPVREPTCAVMARAWRHVESTNNPEAIFLFERELVAGVAGLTRPAMLDELSGGDLATASRKITDLIDAGLVDFDPANAETDITLDEPVVESGVEYATLSLRPARTGEMLKARGHLRGGQGPASQLAYQMSLVGSVAGLPHKVLQLIPVTVAMRAAMTIEVFTVRPPGTGST